MNCRAATNNTANGPFGNRTQCAKWWELETRSHRPEMRLIHSDNIVHRRAEGSVMSGALTRRHESQKPIGNNCEEK